MWIILLLGAFVILRSLWMLGFFGLPVIFHFDNLCEYGSVLVSYYIISTLIAGCLFLGGISFLRLKRWGKDLTAISLVISILLRLTFLMLVWYVFFTASHFNLEAWFKNIQLTINTQIPTYAIILMEIITLYLITRPKIKKQFKLGK